jgi:hypothetical protein
VLEAPWVVEGQIEEEAPDFVTAVEAIATSVGLVASAAFETLSAQGDSASARIFNQATNDLLDLCFDAVTGRGRSAMRAARALYEHSVNANEVVQSIDSSNRYLDHQAVVGVVRAGMTREADFLLGNDRKSFDHEVGKLVRASERDARTAVDKYGPSFRRLWAARNLYDMAKDHGLEAGYDFYRVASASSGAGDQRVSTPSLDFWKSPSPTWEIVHAPSSPATTDFTVAPSGPVIVIGP